MVKIIYAEVPEKLHAMAGQSVHSHLKKLAKDGRVAEERITSAPSRWTLLWRGQVSQSNTARAARRGLAT